ncbi:MAG: radical SAM protein [Candidatus Gracilibacteria bacterium]|nr:radical SAM protein [Candidatus Gracilibacteria bacterium]
MSFYFSSVNLGCSKNLVDLEFAIGQILKFSDRMDIQYFDTPEDEGAEFILVNTCGFLSTAREESEQTLKYFDELGKKVILMGCYVSVKDDAFLSSLKNLYAVLPFTDYATIEKMLLGEVPKVNSAAIAKLKSGLGGLKEGKLREYLASIGGSQIGKKAFVWKGDEIRAYIHAPFGYEYLKIAEGCDNNCTFCIIPKIRGRQKSRPIEDVIKEAEVMIASGIREIEIICQDTTRYGTDLYDEPRLFELLEKLDALPGDFRFRLFYLYPDTLTFAHLERLAKLKKLIPYFDIPFQHYSANILKRMGRFYDQAHIGRLLEYIRANFPGSFIRTAFIIGFPGDTQADSEEHCEFVKKEKFESVGIFQYHDEPLAASSKLDCKVNDVQARTRIKKLGKILDEVYRDHAKAVKGKTFSGYVMQAEEKTVIIRREIQAPEIDEYDEVLYKNIQVPVGEVELGAFVTYTLN